MRFSETLIWFQEPGFSVFFFGFCALAYFISAKGNLLLQVGMCIFCGSFIASHWAKEEYFSMALYWMYSGWAGFLFHKLGGMLILKAIGRVVQRRVESMGREPLEAQSAQQSRPQTQAPPRREDRRESHSQQEEAFRQRERRREQERASAKRATEQRTQQRQSQTESKPPPEPKPAPKPKPEEKKTPPQPEPKRKKFWWEVLEVPQESDLQTIKKAYRAIVQKYHPDRVSHLGEEFQTIAEEKTKAINAAFEEAKNASRST